MGSDDLVSWLNREARWLRSTQEMLEQWWSTNKWVAKFQREGSQKRQDHGKPTEERKRIYHKFLSAKIKILNEALASLDIMKESSSVVASEKKDDEKSIGFKERLERDPFFWLAGFCILAFGMGFGACEAIHRISKTEHTLTKSAKPKYSQMSSELDYLSRLKKEFSELARRHSERLDILQKKIIEAESEAVYGGHLDSNQAKFREMATSLKEAIKEENRSYETQLKIIMQRAGGNILPK